VSASHSQMHRMGLFGKKKVEPDAKPDGETDGRSAIPSEPRKARPWFDRARTVADTGNHDYAIECYLNGLKFDPDSISKHEALREVAVRRKAKGGKPAGMRDSFKRSGGKTPVDRFINAEFMWAKDPLNATLAVAVMDNANKVGLDEVAYWMGGLALEANTMAKRPSSATYLKLRDMFVDLNAYDMAVEACKHAVRLDQGNMALHKQLHDLEAELTMIVGKYGEAGGTFRKGVKDMAKQTALEEDDGIALTGTKQTEMLARLRGDVKDHPEDLDKAAKLVKALLQTEAEKQESEAIDLLTRLHEQTQQYRFKMQVGDVRIKQLNRRIRELRKKASAATEEAARAQLLDQVSRTTEQLVRFELQDYQERVKNYPTDLGLRFKLGVRQLAVGDDESAIASFQESQADPRYRSLALRYLGEAFANKTWFDEAIDTFHRAIEVHPYSDDTLALELRYELVKVLEEKARKSKELPLAEEAAKHCSQIAQADINYKDVRQRLEALRKLIERLKGKSETAASSAGEGADGPDSSDSAA